MFMQILFCDTLLSVRIVYFLKIIMNIIHFIIPMGLILKVTFDFYKGIISGNDDKGEILKKTSTRIVAAVILFLVPTLVGALLSIFNELTDSTSYKDSFYSCYKQVDSDFIKQLENNESDNQ